MNSLGEAIRNARLNRNLTQVELGRRVGCGARYIGHIEANSKSHLPSSELLEDLAHELGVNFNGLMKLKRSEHSIEFPLFQDQRTYDDWPVIECDSFVALSDLHIPFTDWDFLKKVLDLALSWGISTLSIGGDFSNYTNFARFTPPRGYSFEVEIEQMSACLDALTKNFNPIWGKTGNHEVRLLDRALKNQILPQEFARFLTDSPNFHTTEFWYVEFKTPKRSWMTVHPENVSVNPIKVPQDLYSTKFPNMSIIAEHTHSVGWGYTKDGKHYAISSGCMADPIKLDYHMLKASSTAVMKQGAVIVKDDQPWLLTPLSNFNILRELYE